jgi:hypothetical protein
MKRIIDVLRVGLSFLRPTLRNNVSQTLINIITLKCFKVFVGDGDRVCVSFGQSVQATLLFGIRSSQLSGELSSWEQGHADQFFSPVVSIFST